MSENIPRTADADADADAGKRPRRLTPTAVAIAEEKNDENSGGACANAATGYPPTGGIPIPAPLGLGTLVLSDGRTVQGFVCEAAGVAGAEDITDLKSWRAYIDGTGSNLAATA